MFLSQVRFLPQQLGRTLISIGYKLYRQAKVAGSIPVSRTHAGVAQW